MLCRRDSISLIKSSQGDPHTVHSQYDILDYTRVYTDSFHWYRLRSAIPYLVEVLKKEFNESKIAIAFPDEGAWKRFGHFFNMWPLITCIKVRKHGDQRIVTVKEGVLQSQLVVACACHSCHYI